MQITIIYLVLVDFIFCLYLKIEGKEHHYVHMYLTVLNLNFPLAYLAMCVV